MKEEEDTENMDFLMDCFYKRCSDEETKRLDKRKTFDALCEGGKCPTFTEIDNYWKEECTDEEDTIDADQYVKLCKHFGKGELRLRHAMDLFDTDGDGCLDREEFRAMLETIDFELYGNEFDPEIIDEVFDIVDGHGGEKNGVLDINELTQAICAGKIPVIPAPKVIIDVKDDGDDE